jgi:hypothetical protein
VDCLARKFVSPLLQLNCTYRACQAPKLWSKHAVEHPTPVTMFCSHSSGSFSSPKSLTLRLHKRRRPRGWVIIQNAFILHSRQRALLHRLPHPLGGQYTTSPFFVKISYWCQQFAVQVQHEQQKQTSLLHITLNFILTQNFSKV